VIRSNFESSYLVCIMSYKYQKLALLLFRLKHFYAMLLQLPHLIATIQYISRKHPEALQEQKFVRIQENLAPEAYS